MHVTNCDCEACTGWNTFQILTFDDAFGGVPLWKDPRTSGSIWRNEVASKTPPKAIIRKGEGEKRKKNISDKVKKQGNPK